MGPVGSVLASLLMAAVICVISGSAVMAYILYL